MALYVEVFSNVYGLHLFSQFPVIGHIPCFFQLYRPITGSKRENISMFPFYVSKKWTIHHQPESVEVGF